MVFDAPLVKGNFKQRLGAIEKELAKKPTDQIQLCKHTVCRSREHLEELTDNVIGGKGEGMMIKDPKSKYEGRRSNILLKVKRFEDTEAKVIGHNIGTGRCADMLGALQVEEADGKRFKVGSGFNDAQRRKPPKIGSTITFKF